MAQGKGQFLNADLDIFGDDIADSTGTETESEKTSDDKSMDIFGDDDAEEATEDQAEEATETPDEEATEEKTEEETPTGDDELDLDLEKLFDEIEQANEGDNETLKMVDELRKEVANLSTENSILQKKNDSLNEKLMENVGNDSDMGMYKGVIDKLEQNPKLMVLVKNFGNDNDKIKTKLTGIVSDIIFDLTGQDISDMLDQAQSDKLTSLMGSNKESPAPGKSKAEKEEPMDYEESISSLF